MPSETSSSSTGGGTGKRSKPAKADFSKVALSSLRKYKKAHRVRMKPTSNKQELVDAVAKHFATLPPPEDESQLIESFAAALKNHNAPLPGARPPTIQLTDEVVILDSSECPAVQCEGVNECWRGMRPQGDKDKEIDQFSLTYPNALNPAEKIAVKGQEFLKLSTTLGGKCSLVQSNIIFKALDDGQFAYHPLVCGKDMDEVCRVTISPADIPLRPTAYSITLVFSWEQKAGLAGKQTVEYRTAKWPVGNIDFSSVIPPVPPKRGTSDQQEDVFEKIHKENRPPFGTDKGMKKIFKPLIYLSCAMVLLPWVVLLGGWKKLHLVWAPINQISSMTMKQKLFYSLYLVWMALAVANWSGLGTFATIKTGSLLLIPTLVLSLNGLRDSIAPSTRQFKKP